MPTVCQALRGLTPCDNRNVSLVQHLLITIAAIYWVPMLLAKHFTKPWFILTTTPRNCPQLIHAESQPSRFAWDEGVSWDTGRLLPNQRSPRHPYEDVRKVRLGLVKC